MEYKPEDATAMLDAYIKSCSERPVSRPIKQQKYQDQPMEVIADFLNNNLTPERMKKFLAACAVSVSLAATAMGVTHYNNAQPIRDAQANFQEAIDEDSRMVADTVVYNLNTVASEIIAMDDTELGVYFFSRDVQDFEVTPLIQKLNELGVTNAETYKGFCEERGFDSIIAFKQAYREALENGEEVKGLGQ